MHIYDQLATYVVHSKHAFANCTPLGFQFQGYISIGLEERLKYLRSPQKRLLCPSLTDGVAAPTAKRQLKLMMPQVQAVSTGMEGEDDASHQRNVEKLKSLSKQVHIWCTCNSVLTVHAHACTAVYILQYTAV